MASHFDYAIDRIDTFYEFYLRLQSYGEKSAFLEQQQEISYKLLIESINKISQVLKCRNQYVLLNLHSKYYFAAAYFATILSGNTACLQACAPNVDEFYSEFKFAYQLTDAVVASILEGTARPLNYSDNNGIATILFSSGTTAEPKAVALSQRNLISDLLAGIEKYEYPENGRYLSIIPYTHIFGLVCDFLAPMYSGAMVCFVYDMFSFFSMMPLFEPTALHATPGMVEVLLQKLKMARDKESITGRNLKKILSGGAGTPLKLCKEMREFGVNVYGCYGLTECACGVCVSCDNHYKDGSAGVVLNCNIVVLNADGHISVSGRNVMMGYVDRHGHLLPWTDHFFDTGDIGYFDEDNFLFITGRVDDLIVFSDGKKLMPQLVERELNESPYIIESVAFLSNDNLLEVEVFLTDMAFAVEAKRFICSKTFNGHKIASIHISTEPLIRNTLGKICRSVYGKRKNN